MVTAVSSAICMAAGPFGNVAWLRTPRTASIAQIACAGYRTSQPEKLADLVQQIALVLLDHRVAISQLFAGGDQLHAALGQRARDTLRQLGTPLEQAPEGVGIQAVA